MTNPDSSLKIFISIAVYKDSERCAHEFSTGTSGMELEVTLIDVIGLSKNILERLSCPSFSFKVRYYKSEIDNCF